MLPKAGLRVWMPLVGTLRVRTTGGAPGSTNEMSWVVTAVDAPRRISYVTIGDSTTPQLRREDAIIPGPADSVAITVRIMVPDLGAQLPDSAGRGAERLLETTGKLMTATMRLAEQARLELLKKRLETP